MFKRIGLLLILICFTLFSQTSCTQNSNSQSSNTQSSSTQISSTKVGHKTAGITYKYISFDDITPKGIKLKECWNAMGMDNEERVYIGWTCIRDDGREDFAVFNYDNTTGERNFLGTYIDVSTQCNNIQPGEQIPKGHTKIIYIDGKMYMASQGFHDFKEGIDELPKFRGAHLYTYDIKNNKMEDIGRNLPGGVLIKNQGIVALSYMPQNGLLIGLTHPYSNLLLFNVKNNSVEKIVPGIPWKLGNPLSREVVVTKENRIYTYRGVEDPLRRTEEFNMWSYDLKLDKMLETDNKIYGGFWNGQSQTKDGKKTYLITVHGELYCLDNETGQIEHLTHFLTEYETIGNKQINYLYGITLSKDEKNIYAIPTDLGYMYAYDIAAGKVSAVKKVDPLVYTGSDMKDSKGNIYFSSFSWERNNCRLIVINTGDK